MGTNNLLADKVVVITGACGLLGQRFSRKIIESAGKVILTDIDLERGNKLLNELNEIGSGQADFIVMDINDKASIKTAIDTIHQKHLHIDAIVNNAYPRNENYGRKFFDVEYEDFCHNLNVNVGGYFLCSQQFAKYFCEQGSGNIVNIASIYGVVAPTFELYENTTMTMPVEYAAIKSSLIHLTKFMAKQFKGKNIRVNSLSPGGILDSQPDAFCAKYQEQSLNKGMLDPEDICGTLLFLLSDESRFINGQNLLVDDGFTL